VSEDDILSAQRQIDEQAQSDVQDACLNPEQFEELAPKEKGVEGDHSRCSRPARYPVGVVYRGPWENEADGVCIAVRRYALALWRTRIPLFLQSETYRSSNDGVLGFTAFHELPEGARQHIGHLTTLQHEKTALTIRHVVPTSEALSRVVFPRHYDRMTPQERKAMLSTTVLLCAWEAPPSEEDAWMLTKLPELWVTHNQAVEWLVSSGIERERIRVVPHPMDFQDPMRHARAPSKTAPFTFLHIGKWEPRKNQVAIIAALAMWFQPSDDVRVILKCSPYFQGDGGYAKDIEEAINEVCSSPFAQTRGWTRAELRRHIVRYWNVRHTREEMVQLYENSHVYLSTGKTEGFDLPAFDARVAGLPVLHAGWGGPPDYCEGHKWSMCFRAQGASEPTLSYYNYAPGSEWAKYDANELGRYMRQLYMSRDEDLRTPLCFSNYSIDAIGRMMRDRVDELTAGTKVPTKDLSL